MRKRGDIRGRTKIRYEIGNLQETEKGISSLPRRQRESEILFLTSDTEIYMEVHSANDDSNDDCNHVVHELEDCAGMRSAERGDASERVHLRRATNPA
jgi:hypothetical protein